MLQGEVVGTKSTWLIGNKICAVPGRTAIPELAGECNRVEVADWIA